MHISSGVEEFRFKKILSVQTLTSSWARGNVGHEVHGVYRTHVSIDPGYHFRDAPSTKGAVDKSHSLREPLGH